MRYNSTEPPQGTSKTKSSQWRFFIFSNDLYRVSRGGEVSFVEADVYEERSRKAKGCM